MIFLRRNTAATVTVGPFLDATDFKTPETALASQSGRIRKNGTGAAFTPASWAHDADGYYNVGFSAAHLDTRGWIRVSWNDPNTYLPVWEVMTVLDEDEYDALFVDGTIRPANVADKTGFSLAAAQAFNNTGQTTEVPSNEATLRARLTTTRAGNLDNLDAAISSRLATSGYTAPDNAGISSLNTKLTTTRASNLDFLDAAISSRLSAAGYTAPDNAGISSIASNVTDLLGRLTVARAAYLDKLNITGNVAGADQVTALQNDAGVRMVVPPIIERPATSATFELHVFIQDRTGNMEAPDAAPTVALTNAAGTDLSARLGSTTMTLVSPGRYKAVYTAQAAHALEQLIWAVTVTEGGVSRVHGATSVIVDPATSTGGGGGDGFTASDRALLAAIEAKTSLLNFIGGDVRATLDGELDLVLDAPVSSRLASAGYTAPDNAGISSLNTKVTAQRAANLDNLDATISSRLASASYAAPDNSGISSLNAKLTTQRADNLDNLDASVSSRMAASSYTAPDNAGISTLLSRIDVELSTRLAAAGYTAPDNATILLAYGILQTLNAMTEPDGPVNRFTANALEMAPAGGGGGGGGLTLEQDAALMGTYQKVMGLGAGQITAVVPKVNADGTFEVVRGGSYKIALGNAIPFVGFPDFTAQTVLILAVRNGGIFEALPGATVTISDPGGAGQTVILELDSSATGLDRGDHPVHFVEAQAQGQEVHASTVMVIV